MCYEGYNSTPARRSESKPVKTEPKAKTEPKKGATVTATVKEKPVLATAAR